MKSTLKTLAIALTGVAIITSCEKKEEAPKKDIKELAVNFDRSGGIVNHNDSKHLKLKSIEIGDCKWTEGFWADKHKMAEEVMIPHMGTIFKGDIGFAYDNFKKAAGMMEGEALGKYWHDGDFYKWMESTMYLYAENGDEALMDDLDEIIEVIGKAQEDDGYLSTHVQLTDNIKRWSNMHFHELYNVGHLYTSASIHYRVTGKTNFLEIAIKNADYLYTVFAPRDPELARMGFNPSQIMGLVELYRTTKDKKYLELADIFVTMRGSVPMDQHPTVNPNFLGDHNQMRTPLRKETEAKGHAVLANYLWSGAADLYAETGEDSLINALEQIWDSAVNRKMYLTGAQGQTHHGASQGAAGRHDMVHEAFQDDYLMPNKTAYNETCANISNAMFNYRLLSAKGESKFADVMELVMYNSALVGISVEGKDYFYSNPLRMLDGGIDYTHATTERRHRVPYIPVFCCPPNLARTIAKSAGWAYSKSENGIAVNLYGGNQLETTLLDGSKLKLSQKTQYPWEGAVEFTIEECKEEAFEILFRIPEWAAGTTIKINGKDSGVDITPKTFAKVERKWKKGNVVTMNIPMDINFVEGDPRIEETRNQVAVKRGPIVYCIESPDLPEDTNILDVYISQDSKLKTNHKPDFLGGVTMIDADVMLRTQKEEGMYRKLEEPSWKKVKSSFVPYYAWSNRGEAEMTVFVPIVWE
ncbi:glycoside hydrolase family 127 protein [Seonamhaeicola maritimus]|uniref:Glycoside hydrolase family 127 protein n=1 Tax=Seonamhaeicola maritimus TaxID=2591822 RepID=A0A5C7GDA1_9FLAO|nr:beta-L-arabinofuranosidase domain-containing protein [Seonamhaeicola maritimus]TXG34680.1 glycoside hydrolase family 127 protein [Seonamhaeicola maritimus]